MNNWTDIHPDFAREWHGKTYQQRWEELYFTYQETQSWIQVGFEPGDCYEAKKWKRQSFNPQQVAEWIKLGLRPGDCEFVAYLKSKDYQPQPILDLKQLRKEFATQWKNTQECLYKLEDFKVWLEADEKNRSGMEEYWEYFLDWYKERPEIWEATVERGMRSVGCENVSFDKWTDNDKEVEVLYKTIFIWKTKVDSSQPKLLKRGGIELLVWLQKLSYPEKNEKRSIDIPNLPSKLKLKNENSPDYLENSIKYYQDLQDAKKEIERLNSDIQQERIKNKEKIANLEQKNVHLRFQQKEKQLAEIADLQEKLNLAQNQVKKSEHNLRITTQTSEKATQTDFDWNEEPKQKDLKIEEYQRQLTNKSNLTIKTRQINPNPGDSSWIDLSTENENKPLSPSQIRERERQKKTISPNSTSQPDT